MVVFTGIKEGLWPIRVCVDRPSYGRHVQVGLHGATSDGAAAHHAAPAHADRASGTVPHRRVHC